MNTTNPFIFIYATVHSWQWLIPTIPNLLASVLLMMVPGETMTSTHVSIQIRPLSCTLISAFISRSESLELSLTRTKDMSLCLKVTEWILRRVPITIWPQNPRSSLRYYMAYISTAPIFFQGKLTESS